MPFQRNAIATCVISLLLAGCSTAAPVTPTSRLAGPPAWAMEVAKAIPDPKEGEDAKELLGRCRAAHGEEVVKLAPLQRFARRVTRKPE